MRMSNRSGAASMAIAVALVGSGNFRPAAQGPTGEPSKPVTVTSGTAGEPREVRRIDAFEIMATAVTAEVSELRRFDALVDAMARTDELTLASRQLDRQLPGRMHEGFRQFHHGVPVVGGDVSRQLDGGVTVSIFGTIHRNIDLDTAPRLSPNEALARIEREAGAGPATGDPPALVILPHPSDGYVLAYRATMRDLQTYFLNAHSGVIAHVESIVDEQRAAVGDGVGIGGQRKKVSASSAGEAFQTYDRLRPAEIVTLDLSYDEDRANHLIDPAGDRWRPGDVANDSDNFWDDPAPVDAHVHTGLTYDYLFKRHGWNGMNGHNGRILGMVNIGMDTNNAFFYHPPAGPEGSGGVAFGESSGTPMVSADIVAHEVMHGVTWHSVKQRTGDNFRGSFWFIRGPSSFRLGSTTVRCGTRLRYQDDAHPRLAGRVFRFRCRDGRFMLFANQGGAINEAYSDIVGTAVEFSVHGRGSGALRADYTISEDVGPPWRSLENPGSIQLGRNSGIPYPDAYQGLVRFLIEDFDDGAVSFSDLGSVDRGRTIVVLPSYDYSGVHWNSTVISHAFYLAIEGGRNRTTGRTVQGVGGANRGDVERAFFRAMTDLMPSSTNILMAAEVIRQSAIDLFGTGSATYRAMDRALWAVGLQ